MYNISFDFVKEEEKNTKYKRDICENDLKDLINAILPVFKNKMPCRSKDTPIVIQNILGIKERNSEIMQRYCKVNKYLLLINNCFILFQE